MKYASIFNYQFPQLLERWVRQAVDLRGRDKGALITTVYYQERT